MQLKLLNRIATVKDDGTVEFEVPADVESTVINIGPKDVCNEVVDDEPLDVMDLHYIRPLQIVMLIVGTRGDVQPFVAIGKRLQVNNCLMHLKLSFGIYSSIQGCLSS